LGAGAFHSRPCAISGACRCQAPFETRAALRAAGCVIWHASTACRPQRVGHCRWWSSTGHCSSKQQHDVIDDNRHHCVALRAPCNMCSAKQDEQQAFKTCACRCASAPCSQLPATCDHSPLAVQVLLRLPLKPSAHCALQTLPNAWPAHVPGKALLFAVAGAEGRPAQVTAACERGRQARLKLCVLGY
jgi:hypothetical protein